jgi:tetratricopeptide (TPR) repeat protein
MRQVFILLPVTLLLACGEPGQNADQFTDSPLPPGAQAISLLGDTLYPPELLAEVRADREVRLAEARADYEADPSDVDALIWYGRRTAYLGDYRQAIEIYSNGIERHPDEPRLYRHRGHRYISVRRVDAAIADLERAAELIADREDRIEPDGLPNARNIPTSTLHSNIWYHLGLAYYLKGDFENALRAYRRCMAVSRNPDMLVATSYWLYITLRRLDRVSEAAAVLEPIDADLDIIENGSYHRLLLMYKGELGAETLVEEAEAGGDLENATLGYGVGSWHLYNGRRKLAEAAFRNILKGPQWAAFGYIAAEADLQRLGG